MYEIDTLYRYSQTFSSLKAYSEEWNRNILRLCVLW